MPRTFTVMTYNVHSCIGMDEKISPQRIAQVIDQCNPDIVALQELDSGLFRTEMTDQAHLICLLSIPWSFYDCAETGKKLFRDFPCHLDRGHNRRLRLLPPLL